MMDKLKVHPRLLSMHLSMLPSMHHKMHHLMPLSMDFKHSPKSVKTSIIIPLPVSTAHLMLPSMDLKMLQ